MTYRDWWKWWSSACVSLWWWRCYYYSSSNSPTLTTWRPIDPAYLVCCWRSLIWLDNPCSWYLQGRKWHYRPPWVLGDEWGNRVLRIRSAWVLWTAIDLRATLSSLFLEISKYCKFLKWFTAVKLVNRLPTTCKVRTVVGMPLRYPIALSSLLVQKCVSFGPHPTTSCSHVQVDLVQIRQEFL